MQYLIRKKDSVDFFSLEKKRLKNAQWGLKYRPSVEFGVLRFEDKFYFYFECFESNPHVSFDDTLDTYNDSCLGIYINFKPELSEQYVNIELNSKGSIRCGFGKDNETREYLPKDFKGYPTVKVKVLDNYWAAAVIISDDLIAHLYGTAGFAKGDILKGNILKFGSIIDQPHCVSWSYIASPEANVHQPGYFGDFIMKDE